MVRRLVLLRGFYDAGAPIRPSATTWCRHISAAQNRNEAGRRELVRAYGAMRTGRKKPYFFSLEKFSLDKFGPYRC